MAKTPGDLPKSNIGKATTINGERRGTILDEVTLTEDSSIRKYFVLQRVSLSKKTGASRTYLRLGYYVLGKNRRRRRQWVWANRSPLILRRIFLS